MTTPSKVLLISLALCAPAAADTYETEPTAGTPLPTAPLAGEFDGRVVATNPGGSSLIRGSELALVFDGQAKDDPESTGRNTGLYMALAGSGGIGPRFGFGFGVDWLHSAGTETVDLGKRVRFTSTSGLALGPNAGIGFAWHHFRDDGVLEGVDTFDAGLSARGKYLALGAVMRDLNTPKVGDQRVPRRYELELAGRPLGTDQIEIAIGARTGGDHRDGWGRASYRIVRGLFAQVAFESRSTTRVDDAGMAFDGRDYRFTGGLEVSLGGMGVTGLASVTRDDTGATGPLGGQVLLRASSVGPASVLPRRDHVERVELSGDVDMSKTTALVRRLRDLADDRSVKAVVVVLDRAQLGPAVRREIRDELVALRRAGKRVFAHMLSGTQPEYFVASAADKIFLDPAVDLDIVGVSLTRLYLRGALDKLGAVPQFVKIGEYKDAPEQFTELKPTASSNKQTDELVDSLWDNFVTDVATSRWISKDEVRKLVDAGPYTADGLESTHLIDGVATTQELPKLLETQLGRALPETTRGGIRPDRWVNPRVAVIYIDGEIVRGKTPARSLLGGGGVGDESIVAALKTAREDSSIGAVVLRINSPGGDALASELISREVFATRGKKPIICSFGDYAASGGYFVAAGCDQIIAEPTTITGSIGVFGGKLDISAVAHSLGVSTTVTKRGTHAGIGDLFGLPLVPLPLAFGAWNDDDTAKLMASVRHAYDRFVGAVARGRNMTPADVDAIGRGRVWSGEQARQVKLVDRLGGLNDAIAEASRRGRIPSSARVELLELPKAPGVLDALRGLSTRSAIGTLPRRSAIQARLMLDLDL